MSTNPYNPQTPTDAPFTSVTGLYNLRDVGGYPLPSSTKTKAGVLYRGGILKPMPVETLSGLSALGVRTVFDFRSRPEIEKVARGGDPLDLVGGKGKPEDFQSGEGGVAKEGEPDELVMLREGFVEREGVRRVWAPVFAKRDFSPAAVERRLKLYAEGGMEGFVKAYEEAMRDGVDAFRTVLLHLAKGADEEVGGTMVHCSGGKDRTGIFGGLLLSTLGVERNIVAEEYHFTHVGLSPLKDYFEAKDRDLWQHPLFQGPEGQLAVRRMIGSPAEVMTGLLEMMDRVFGGPEGYMRNECGLTDEDMARLRKAMTVQA